MSAAAHPRRVVLHGLRPLCRAIVRTRYRVRVHGVDNVPGSGPVILAANHIGVIDGPLLTMFAPRGVHALTKLEMFHGPLGRFLGAAGQIPLDRFRADPAAIKTCLTVLDHGSVVGVFPEGTRGDGELGRFHHGAAYLALVTGAPVVPVTMLGTREPGGSASSLPTRGAHVDIVFSAAWQVAAQPWPRRREAVRSHSADLRSHMQRRQEAALARLGRQLPGPLPTAGTDNDPDTGFIDHQAGST